MANMSRWIQVLLLCLLSSCCLADVTDNEIATSAERKYWKEKWSKQNPKSKSVANEEKNSSPTWSNTYISQGVLHIPYAEIDEPFYAWVDFTNGRSRIDYYGGMVKTYQLSKDGAFGSLKKIAPMTTEKVHNENNCFLANGTADEPVSPQSVLPDLTDFKLVGTEVINGLTCEKWQYISNYGDKQNRYTVWLQWQYGDNQVKIIVPVRYEMKGYNTLLGSHYDHYYLDYETFSAEVPSDDVFAISSDVGACHSFPGPGSDHIYTFTPMREFIHGHSDHVDQAFDTFRKHHQKKYQNETEHHLRKHYFQQNMRYIHSKNRAGLGYRLAPNHLADYSNIELKYLRGKLRSTGFNGGTSFVYARRDVETLPEQFDWRLYGAVSSVKDQSVCGSCWSFGTVGALEGALFLKTGKLTRLSQQALIDCSWGFGNNGCDGGEDFRVYQWMMKHGGIPTEESYGPYLGADGYCHLENATLVAPIHGYTNVTSGDLDALKVAIFKHGPISVAIDASHRSFSFYANGVYYEPECGNDLDSLDHAVLAVGYGVLNGQPYWLVKNSWSTYWGNDGYVLMSQKDNNCGVATSPTFVLM